MTIASDTDYRERPGQAIADEFCDALWLEDGLSKNTLEAYKRDLLLFAEWLHDQKKNLYEATDVDLNAYFAFRHASSKASSANRRLAVLKRFYQHALRNHRISIDPCLKLRSAKQPPRFPKTLSEANVEALLSAPETSTPLGLRDRTMLELMYASGLRVSELVLLKSVEVGMNEGVLRITGKGSKTRLVPFGEEARSWIERYLRDGRPAIAGRGAPARAGRRGCSSPRAGSASRWRRCAGRYRSSAPAETCPCG